MILKGSMYLCTLSKPMINGTLIEPLMEPEWNRTFGRRLPITCLLLYALLYLERIPTASNHLCVNAALSLARDVE